MKIERDRQLHHLVNEPKVKKQAKAMEKRIDSEHANHGCFRDLKADLNAAYSSGRGRRACSADDEGDELHVDEATSRKWMKVFEEMLQGHN